jgi:hypothetical protein
LPKTLSNDTSADFNSTTAAVGMTDIHDGAPWTEMDIEDLKTAVDHGCSIQDAAEFLCRSGTVDEVKQKCDELGLNARLRRERES